MGWMFRTTLMIALSTGCGGLRYQQAMQAGGKAAKEGAWDDAMERYVEAQGHKPTDAAEARYREARDRAVAEALEVAREALANDAFETAMERLDYVQRLDGDEVEAFSLRRQVEASMIGRGTRAFERGDAHAAYLLGIRLKTLFPEANQAGPLLDTIRGHYIATALTHRGARSYEEALASIQTIRGLEPDREDLVAPVETNILVTWADDLVKQARADEKAGQLGEAAIALARAWALAKRPADRDEARRVAERLREQGAFSVKLTITGPHPRATVFRDALSSPGKALPELVLTTKEADLELRLTVPPVRCTETSASTPKTLDYVAGRVEVPNPERLRIEKEIEEAVRAHDKADATATALWAKVEALRDKADGLGREVEEAERVRADAQRKEDSAKEQAEAAERVKGEKESALHAARARSAADAELKSLQAALDQATSNLREWQAAVSEARVAREKADVRLDAATKGRGPAQDTLDKLRSDYQHAMNDRDAHAKTRSSLTGDLRHVTRTVMQDVNKTLSYEEKHWTRTCEAPAAATVLPRWKTALPTNERYTPSKQTEDTSHIGHALAKLEANPKAYPESDAGLVAAADADTAQKVLTWLGTLADEHYKQQLRNLVERPLSSDALAMYIGAPGRVDAEWKDAVRKAAAAKGVEDLDEVLGISSAQ